MIQASQGKKLVRPITEYVSGPCPVPCNWLIQALKLVTFVSSKTQFKV